MTMNPLVQRVLPLLLLSAVLGVQTAYGNGLQADLVTGPAANTVAAVRLVRELSGHRALNLLDRNTYPELVDLLKKALSL